MNVRLAGYQPQYFPRLHYLARILDADIFKIVDNVQFVPKHIYTQADGTPGRRGPSYQVHAPIKTANGVFLLALSAKHGGKLPINQTKVEYHTGWNQKHASTINFAYARSRQAALLMPQITSLLEHQFSSVADLNVATLLWSLAWILGQPTLPFSSLTLETINQLLSQPHPFRLRKIVYQSQTSIRVSGQGRDATDSIIESCQILGANEYIYGGTAASAYLDINRLKNSGITCVQQHWIGTPYQQQFPRLGFIPNLSCIDLLANENYQTVVGVLQGATAPLPL